MPATRLGNTTEYDLDTTPCGCSLALRNGVCAADSATSTSRVESGSGRKAVVGREAMGAARRWQAAALAALGALALLGLAALPAPRPPRAPRPRPAPLAPSAAHPPPQAPRPANASTPAPPAPAVPPVPARPPAAPPAAPREPGAVYVTDVYRGGHARAPRAVRGARRAAAAAGAGDVGAGARRGALRRAPHVGPLRAALRRRAGLRAGRAAARAGAGAGRRGRALQRPHRRQLRGRLLEPHAQDDLDARVDGALLRARAAPAQDRRRHVRERAEGARVRDGGRPPQRDQDHLGPRRQEVAPEANDAVEVFRVVRRVGEVEGRVPRLHDGPGVPGDGRLRGAAAARGAGRAAALPAAGGRVRDGGAGGGGGRAPRARARLLQPQAGAAPLRHPAHRHRAHGALPRAVRLLAETARRQDQVRQLVGRLAPADACCSEILTLRFIGD